MAAQQKRGLASCWTLYHLNFVLVLQILRYNTLHISMMTAISAFPNSCSHAGQDHGLVHIVRVTAKKDSVFSIFNQMHIKKFFFFLLFQCSWVTWDHQAGDKHAVCGRPHSVAGGGRFWKISHYTHASNMIHTLFISKQESSSTSANSKKLKDVGINGQMAGLGYYPFMKEIIELFKPESAHNYCRLSILFFW